MNHEQYIRRCFQLASYGKPSMIKSNPPVGAILVHDHKIIGEGYHEYMGGPHAEVNCFSSVDNKDRHLIRNSTLYVSLEPCNHHGLTPPCTSRIISEKIKHVVVSCLDPSEKNAGKGINKLKSAGIKVQTGVLEEEGKEIIHRFTVNQLFNRPEISLKIVQSKDYFIGRKGEHIWLSSETTGIFTHKLRGEKDAILVGVNTVLNDNPSLTTRHYKGPHPTRVLIDFNQRISNTFKVFSEVGKVLYFTEKERQDLPLHVSQIEISKNQPIRSLLTKLYSFGINSLIVEGGSTIINSFVKENLWDYAYIISTDTMLYSGIKAASVIGKKMQEFQIENDRVVYIKNNN